MYFFGVLTFPLANVCFSSVCSHYLIKGIHGQNSEGMKSGMDKL